MPFFEIRVRSARHAPGVGIATLNGAIDGPCVDRLQRELVEARRKGLRTFVLDLENVRYINSTGLSYLVNLSDVLGTGGEALHLAAPSPKVKVVFDLMGLTGLFQIHRTVEGAVRALAVRPLRRLKC